MGNFKTYREIENKVRRETDTQSEKFVPDTELLDYVNEAIDFCESNIHTLGAEDNYFLKDTYLPMKMGQEIFELPEDIYASKIKGFVFEDNTSPYPIQRIRGEYSYTNIAFIKANENYTNDYYKYIVKNPNAGENSKIQLIPRAQETNPERLRLWYIRQANRMTDFDSICDIPEFAEYIVKRVRFMIYYKEGNPLSTKAEDLMVREEKRMIDTLSNKVPDGDNRIIADFSHYWAMGTQGVGEGDF